MTDTVMISPCPFCGGVAEIDTTRGYRSLISGKAGSAVAIYCTTCDADMMRCLEDMPALSVEAIEADLIEAWNRRSSPPPPSGLTDTVTISRACAEALFDCVDCKLPLAFQYREELRLAQAQNKEGEMGRAFPFICPFCGDRLRTARMEKAVEDPT